MEYILIVIMCCNLNLGLATKVRTRKRGIKLIISRKQGTHSNLVQMSTSKIVEKILKSEYLNWGYERHDLDNN
jgi:hypothetical protein